MFFDTYISTTKILLKHRDFIAVSKKTFMVPIAYAVEFDIIECKPC